MHLPVVLGTARIGRRSEAVATKIIEILNGMNISTELVDVRDYPMTASDNSGQSENASRWRTILEKSVGFILVSPEYNRGYPGELKMFLDLLYWEYKQKVVAIVSVSDGQWGGTRMAEHIRSVLNTFSMLVMGPAIHVPSVPKHIDENGKFEMEKFEHSIQRITNQMIELASKLNSD